MAKFISVYFLVFAMLSCSKNNEPILMLISPDIDAQLDVGRVGFNWESNQEGPFKFLLSTNEDFSNPIVDSLVQSTSLTIPNLFPSSRYHWQVSARELFSNSTFSILNPLSDINGFNGNTIVNESYEDKRSPVRFDSTYTEYVAFEFMENQISIASDNNTYMSTCDLNSLSTDEELAIYVNSTVPGSDYHAVFFYYGLDSISLIRFEGTKWEGTTWSSSFKK